MLASGIIIAHHAFSSGECWCAVLGFLAGLIIGVHMAQPKWLRGR